MVRSAGKEPPQRAWPQGCVRCGLPRPGPAGVPEASVAHVGAASCRVLHIKPRRWGFVVYSELIHATLSLNVVYKTSSAACQANRERWCCI